MFRYRLINILFLILCSLRILFSVLFIFYVEMIWKCTYIIKYVISSIIEPACCCMYFFTGSYVFSRVFLFFIFLFFYCIVYIVYCRSTGCHKRILYVYLIVYFDWCFRIWELLSLVSELWKCIWYVFIIGYIIV